MSTDKRYGKAIEALLERAEFDRIVDGLTPEQRVALWHERYRPTLISLIRLWIDETGSSGENVSVGKETACAIQKFSPNNELLALDEEYLINLVDAASKDVDAYDLVERLIVVISSSGAPLPPPLAKIAADKH